MSKAGFTINGDPSVNRGFVATSGQVLTVRLEDPTVQTATFDVVSTTGGDPTVENSGQLSPVTGDLDITLPATDFDSFMLRCEVTYQEGPRTKREVFERIVAVTTDAGIRKILPSETTQFDPYMGWAGAFNAAIRVLGGIAEPYASVVVFERDAIQTAVANSDGRIVWALAPSGHVSGVSKTLVIPANTVDAPEKIILAPDLNIANAAAFDPAQRCHVFASCYGTHFSGSLEVVPARDAAAPTLVSATVRESNKDGLELTFAEPVVLANLASVTLTFSSGTPRTITALESGNGTTTIVLDMSGDWVGTEVAEVVLAAGAFRDLNGVASGADTEAILNQADGVVFSNTIGYWRSDSVVESGGVVSAMTDRSGEGNHVNNLVAIQQPGLLASRINGHPSVNFDGTDDFLANYDIKIGGAEPTDLNSYTILAVVKFDTTTAESLFSAFPDSPATIFEGILILLEVANMKVFAPGAASQALKAFSSTGWNEFRFEITQAQRRMWINGVLQTDDGGNWNSVADTPPLKGIRIGLEAVGTYGQMNGELAELRYIGRTLTSPEATSWDGYVASRYGL
jgi:hypothetical protein